MEEHEDGFDLPIPEEMRPWLEYQKKSHQYDIDKFLARYILVKGKIKVVKLMEWAVWFENFDNRRIDLTDISNEQNYKGGDRISTVFLGIDHNFNFDDIQGKLHVPVLFETIVFGGEHDQLMWRYATYNQAKKGHWDIVTAIRSGHRPDIHYADESIFNDLRDMFGHNDKDSI